jgi:hypothetical protein
MKPDISPRPDEELLACYDEELRVQVEYPESLREATADVVRFIRPAPGMNFVSYTFAGEPNLDHAIEEQLAYFTPMGQPFTWKVWEHDCRPDLEHKLAARGFVRDDDDPGMVMILDVKEATPQLREPGRADIRRISEAGGLSDVIHVLDRVYGNDNSWVNGRLGGHMQVPGYLSVYAAYVDGQPAAVAWTYFPGRTFATLFAGSTLTEHRNKGLYTGLLATRLQEIRSRGIQFAIVDAGSMSRPIVAKYGFRYLTTQYDYEWQADSES